MMSTPEEIEGRVRAALEELGIAGWEWIEIDPQYGDTAHSAAVTGRPAHSEYDYSGQQAGQRRHCAG